ncbi:RNA polymerase sigma-70 factor (ECF subfamily) [Chitinophaga skermanii]|uniref:RNA polymerase sigma-70 factor (ECF subfamily) n=1 Tax=Chitinophaga skermanii TaxID=331697 RepID=A0A327R4S8_9BACT|nr:sigma-70 family RNA polymerase sigma factor [Chitinophaga skermanii]RAJ10952.1 RNA polymerase sigma-70 factor (ECF subfamily) [Chitinophaga skermanii]
MDNLQSYSDESLWQLVSSGNEYAFALLFDRYWELMLKEAMIKTGSEQDAMDCTQELFIKLWNHRAQLTIQSSFRAYIFTALKHRVISHFRAAYTAKMVLVEEYNDPLEEHTDLMDEVQAKEVATLVATEVEKMPSKMQRIYRMSREQGMNIHAIATALDISEQTVKNQLTTALKRLRIAVVQYYGNMVPLLLVSPILYSQVVFLT